MELIAYCLAILVGASLSLFGSGGSILSVPIMVYLLGLDAQTAGTYSLFIVGTVAIIGSVKLVQSGNVEWKYLVFFGIPSLLGLILMRRILLPLIPQTFHLSSEISFTKNNLILITFAVLMLFSAASMLSKKEKTSAGMQNLTAIGFFGFAIGLLTGFVGVGGGFMIIPALVFFGGVEMKAAVSTSLFIIAINSLIGFLASMGHTEMRWLLLMVFTACAMLGLILGNKVKDRLSNAELKTYFAYFILLVSVYIMLKEIFFS
ncbi:MAG TPA: sulfite exporter TauE/SafE family protein [Saprospiraceae bacterium]|nr:sulfite exporter TauE/SafE family protein [Saprospiraceae bacterium]